MASVGVGIRSGGAKGLPRSLVQLIANIDTEIAAAAASAGLYALFREEQASGVNAGTFTSGAWRTRLLNTEVFDEIGITLASNQLTGVPAGDYEFWASCPVISVANHQCRLRNITGVATILEGESTFADVAGNGTEHSVLHGRFTLAVASTIELQHICTTTKAANGFGNATALAAGEVYSSIRLRKVA